MKMIPSFLKRPVLLAFAAALVSSPAYALTVHVDEDFSEAVPPDQLPGAWEIPSTHAITDNTNPENWTITDDPPADGTSIWIRGGNVILGDDDAGEWLAVTASDEEPIVFRVSIYDFMEEPDNDDDVATQSYVQLGDLDQTILLAVGVFAQDERYEVRSWPGHNWFTLDAERSEGWHTFTFVVREDTFDVYVNEDPFDEGAAPDPNATNRTWAGGAEFGWIDLGGNFSTTAEAFMYDNVYLANDPAAARTIDIVEQPQGGEVPFGFDFDLSVVAEADTSLTYQWRKDGADLDDADPRVSGATSDTLTISEAEFEDSGNYRVFVSDESQTVPSEVAAIDVQPFVFVESPETLQLEEGGTAVFSVEVSGEETFEYQWFRGEGALEDGGRISGATSTSLTITDASPADAGDYFVEVTNPHGTRDSEVARLIIAPAPTGVRFADFEDIELPSPNGSVLFQAPSFSGSTNFRVTSPNLSQVTDDVPEGNWGAQSLLVNFSFVEDQDNPWLRLTTFNTTNLANPIIRFDQYFRFDVYTNQDVYLAFGVRDNGAEGEIGEDGGAAGPIEWIGGTTDNEREGLTGDVPPLGRLVRAGEWTSLFFNIPEEPLKAFTGNATLDNVQGTLEHIAIVPVIDEEGDYSTDPFEIYFDNFEVTEVGPPDFVGPPRVAANRTADGNVRVRVTGEANASFALEVSTDLVDWDPLTTIDADGGGVAEYIEEDVAGFPRRFYRVNLED